MKSKDSGSYNGANRPVCFRNEETDTTVDCGYDSQGRRYFKKVTVAGTDVVLRNYTYDVVSVLRLSRMTPAGTVSRVFIEKSFLGFLIIAGAFVP